MTREEMLEKITNQVRAMNREELESLNSFLDTLEAEEKLSEDTPH